MSYTREQLLQIQSAARVYQAQWDKVFQPWGMRAPEPVFGQLPNEYDRDMAVKAKKLLPDGHELREVQYRTLNDDAYQALKPSLQKDVSGAADRPNSALPGEVRQITRINPVSGHKETHWIGQRSFIEDFKQPTRRVLGFLDGPSGRHKNTNGRYR